MSHYGVLPSFSPITRLWSTFKNRLSQWFIVNDIEITEETAIKRRAVLLHALDDGTYELAKYLASPKTLEGLPYEDIIKILDDHFTPKRRGFINRHKFYSAIQLSHETYREWGARLRGLVESCGFSDVEEALRDRFVMGSTPGLVKERLYEQDTEKLTLLEAVELAESVHCARDERFAGTNLNFRYNNKGPFGASNYASGGQFGATTAPTSGFGSCNTGSWVGGTMPTAPAFGTANTPDGLFGATPKPTSGFGSTSTGSWFGGTMPTAPAFGTANTPDGLFGASPKPTSGFGSTNTGGLFGATPKPTSGFGSTNTGGLFGATPKPTSGFGSTNTGGLFGATPKLTSGFGSTNTGGLFDVTTSPAFGTANNPDGLFGATPKPASGFGSTSTGGLFDVTTSTAPAFGTANNPGGLFGETPKPTSEFGSTNSDFSASTTSRDLFQSQQNKAVFETKPPGIRPQRYQGCQKISRTNSLAKRKGLNLAVVFGFQQQENIPPFGTASTRYRYDTFVTTSDSTKSTVPVGGFGTNTSTAFDTKTSTADGFGTKTSTVDGFGTNTSTVDGFDTNTSTVGDFGTNTSSAGVIGTNTFIVDGFGTKTSTVDGFGINTSTAFDTKTSTSGSGCLFCSNKSTCGHLFVTNMSTSYGLPNTSASDGLLGTNTSSSGDLPNMSTNTSASDGLLRTNTSSSVLPTLFLRTHQMWPLDPPESTEVKDLSNH